MDHLATGCAPLDGLLDGGLESDAITLVFGEGGSGKTNLALQCARQVALAGKRVGYVDTEGVSSIRLRQVFSAAPALATVMPDTEGGDALVDLTASAAAPGLRGLSSMGMAPTDSTSLRELESKVLFFMPYTIEEQERLVSNATRVPGLGLLVVDSINMHYRLHIDTGGDAEAEASRSLYKQLHHLTGFARQNQVPVLVTGQVYGGEDATQPFARRTMEHLVKALVRFEKRPDGARKATILKHRSIEEGRSARFRIGPHGLDPAEP
ncbi:MAG TPA: AAA family ATPase [Candidatus Thermoplasmatota archaeon]|nr:AAA family ATPase [Candidatus Thermoplasmatota archaeon]